jgi:regulator of protease activity HflC (stomatin/prohibitin superfamily)
MKKLSIFTMFAILFSVALTSCTRVGPGYTGFKYSYAGDNKGKPEIEPAIGWVTFMPGFSTVVEFPTSIQHYEGEVTSFCKYGAAIKCKVGYNYKVNPGRSADVYFNFKTDNLETITNGFLFNTLRNTINNVAGNTTLDSFISNTPAFSAQVDKILTDSMRSHGFEVSQFGFVGNPEILDPAIHAAVNNKIRAKQDAETSQQQLQISVAEANKDIAKARGDSAAAVIRAQGEAEAIKVKQAFLNPTYVEYIKWNNANENVPRVPQYMGAGGILIK